MQQDLSAERYRGCSRSSQNFIKIRRKPIPSPETRRVKRAISLKAPSSHGGRRPDADRRPAPGPPLCTRPSDRRPRWRSRSTEPMPSLQFIETFALSGATSLDCPCRPATPLRPIVHNGASCALHVTCHSRACKPSDLSAALHPYLHSASWESCGLGRHGGHGAHAKHLLGSQLHHRSRRAGTRAHQSDQRFCGARHLGFVSNHCSARLLATIYDHQEQSTAAG